MAAISSSMRCVRPARSAGRSRGGVSVPKKPYPLKIRMTVSGAGRRRADRCPWPSCRALARNGHGNGHHSSDNGSHATAYANRQGLAHFSLPLVARYWLLAELSARTFCIFSREFSSFRRQGTLRESDADPGQDSTRLLGRPRDPLSPGQSPPDVRGPDAVSSR
jgi:hypothetical protein